MRRSTVSPELAYPNIGEAIDRLSNAFGFTLRIRIGDHRAQLNVGDGVVILIEAARGISLKSAVMIRVEDVNAHYERARRNGVHMVREPPTIFTASANITRKILPATTWCFSHSTADVDPRDWGGTPGYLSTGGI